MTAVSGSSAATAGAAFFHENKNILLMTQSVSAGKYLTTQQGKWIIVSCRAPTLHTCERALVVNNVLLCFAMLSNLFKVVADIRGKTVFRQNCMQSINCDVQPNIMHRNSSSLFLTFLDRLIRRRRKIIIGRVHLIESEEWYNRYFCYWLKWPRLRRWGIFHCDAMAMSHLIDPWRQALRGACPGQHLRKHLGHV